MAVILSVLSLYIAGKFNSKLENFLGIHVIFTIEVFSFIVILILLYYGFNLLSGALKKEKEEDLKKDDINSMGGCIDNNNDLYLREKNISSNLREYQVENCKKEIIWYSKCMLSRGNIQSIELYSSKPNIEMNLQVAKSPDELRFIINDKKTAIGYLNVEKNGLFFSDLTEHKIVTVYEEEQTQESEDINTAYMIATLTPFPGSKKPKQYLIKGKSTQILGKYYLSIHNIDLTPDINCEFDRRMAIIAAIFLEVQFNKH